MSLDTLMQSPIAWAISLFFTVVSVPFAIFFFIKSKRKLEISYYYLDSEIVSNGKSFVSELQLLFHGKAINNITVTRLALWNSGNEVLNHSDIVDSKKLCIFSDNPSAEILDAIVIKHSDETNQFGIENKTSKYVELNFDYLNKRDGIVVQIMHTGERSSLKFDCKIKGGKKPKSLNEKSKKTEGSIRMQTKKKKLATLMILLIGIVIITCIAMVLTVLGIIPKEILSYPFSKSTNDNSLTSILISLLSVAYIIVFSIMGWSIVKRVYHINIPKKLRNDIELNND